MSRAAWRLRSWTTVKPNGGLSSEELETRVHPDEAKRCDLVSGGTPLSPFSPLRIAVN